MPVISRKLQAWMIMEGRRSSESETLHFNNNNFLVISDFSDFKIKLYQIPWELEWFECKEKN